MCIPNFVQQWNLKPGSGGSTCYETRILLIMINKTDVFRLRELYFFKPNKKCLCNMECPEQTLSNILLQLMFAIKFSYLDWVEGHTILIICTKGTQYSIDTPSTPQLILNRHSININCQSSQSTNFWSMYMSRQHWADYQLNVDQVFIEYRPSIDQVVDWVLSEMLIKGIDHHLTADTFSTLHMMPLFCNQYNEHLIQVWCCF